MGFCKFFLIFFDSTVTARVRAVAVAVAVVSVMVAAMTAAVAKAALVEALVGSGGNGCRDRSRSVSETYSPLALARLYGEFRMVQFRYCMYKNDEGNSLEESIFQLFQMGESIFR